MTLYAIHNINQTYAKIKNTSKIIKDCSNMKLYIIDNACNFT